jgi:hypothetical protein
MGHGDTLQALTSVFSPKQLFPKGSGDGSLQDRVRVLIPPLQVTLQLENSVQSPQLPS